MAESIFFTAVDKDVQKVLNTRKGYHSSENRESGAHSWLFKKIAWAEAFAVNEAGNRRASLVPPTKGGLGRYTGSGTSGGLYKAFPSNDGSLKFFPKPHIESVNISADGDFGSVVRAEVKFTIYTLTDLDLYQAFFDPGADLTITWGWNKSGGGGGRDGKFQGKIVNFSYNLNSMGGFDCSTQAVGPGIAIVGGNIDAPQKGDGKQLEDALGNAIQDNSIINAYKIAETELIQQGNNSEEPVDGIVLVKYHKDWAEADGVPGENGSTTPVNQGEPESRLYISLERFVKDINKLAQQNSEWFAKNAKIICDGETTRGLVPANSEKLISANPTEILFPGYATYGDNNAFKFGTYDSAMTQGDLSKIMISFKWLQEAFAMVGTEKLKGQKSADSSVAGLLQKIFDLIHKHSGERFKLAMVTKPKTTTGTELLIVDGNYIETDKIKPYPITVVTQGSIVRSVSMQTKVPNEMNVSAFVATNNPFSKQNGASIQGVITAAGGTQEEAPEPDLPSLAMAKKAMDGTGVTPDNVKTLQAAMIQERVASGPDFANGAKEIIPFPLDFSVTLDGINGIVFGNVITCNYMPSVYSSKNTKLAFTVTKVNHSISNGDWTTTLNTVCRIISLEKQ